MTRSGAPFPKDTDGGLGDVAVTEAVMMVALMVVTLAILPRHGGPGGNVSRRCGPLTQRGGAGGRKPADGGGERGRHTADHASATAPPPGERG